MMLLFLLLILIPLVAHKLAKRYKSRKLWAVTLSCFGAIVCPLGFGIYGLGITHISVWFLLALLCLSFPGIHPLGTKLRLRQAFKN